MTFTKLPAAAEAERLASNLTSFTEAVTAVKAKFADALSLIE